MTYVDTSAQVMRVRLKELPEVNTSGQAPPRSKNRALPASRKPVCLFPVPTLSLLPTGTAGVFCLFGSSHKWTHTAHTFTAAWGQGHGAPPIHRPCSEQRHPSEFTFCGFTHSKNDLESQRPRGVRDKKALVMGGVGWSKSHRRGGPIPRS